MAASTAVLSAAPHRAPDEPIRAEQFGVERLEEHGESLARAQQVVQRAGRPLLSRVRENARVLREAYQVLSASSRLEGSLSPAVEWFIDNYHVIDEQLRLVRNDLPPAFYHKLPKLAAGHLEGYPRAYGIAWAFVAHTDSRFEPDMLRRFLDAYQRVNALTIGELWGVPILLRAILVENLRRLAELLLRRRAARLAAVQAAEQLHASASPASVLAALERGPLESAFAAELVQRLRDLDPATSPALLWLDRRLAVQGTTRDAIVQHDHQQLAAITLTVRNIVTSMRLISALDWATFVESVSLVDRVLRDGSNFGAMDFVSRDRYRHAIEELAHGAERPEVEIAREAVRHAAQGADARRRDPGFYLLGGGRFAFEAAVGWKPSLDRRLLRVYVAAAAPGYVGSIVLLTALLLIWLLRTAAQGGLDTAGLIAFTLLALVPASDVAIAVLNRTITTVLPPRILPRLELSGSESGTGVGKPPGAAVPAELRTMVVVPVLLSNVKDVEQQLERLEVHYLANPEGYVHFALLSDWPDAARASVDGDAPVLESGRAGIARLNALHGPVPDGTPRFFFFHRHRLWNEGQRAWMGWERKRGKLHEFNRLLRGAADTTFVSDKAPLPPPGVRYVITLDADTRLPIGAVRRLVGTMAHPLNEPRLDPTRGRVVEGYGLLQPRVTPPLPGRASSYFQRVSSGPAGIDPYAAAVSDVYQDLFGEGSYTGKGIYDVDAFTAALDERVPENTLLSHDLLEGLFARAGLVTDIELFEPVPSHYSAAAARQDRWARGDWQLLPWIFRAPVPLIGRWKMLDNLRRTLVAPLGFATIVASWIWPHASPGLWTGFILATIAIPPLLPVLAGLVPRGIGLSKRAYARAVARDLSLALSHVALGVILLAHQAWLMAAAISRTLVRIGITHRKRLEWMTAAQAAAAVRLDLGEFYHSMAGGLVMLGAAVALMVWHPFAWQLAAPLLVAWAAAPAVARWVSLPRPTTPLAVLPPDEVRALRLVARRTWHFFTTFVGSEDHALPPDNFQEDPEPVVAHRTSPTNIGLYLTSILAALDFGWIGTLETVERLEATLETMEGLERFRGHFYNWYDTRDGRPLEPRYVSSVDSGNLLACLMALRTACLEVAQRPVFLRERLEGIADLTELVREAIAGNQALEEALHDVARLLGSLPATLGEWEARLGELDRATAHVASVAQALMEQRTAGPPSELLEWTDGLRATVQSHQRDCEGFAAGLSGPAPSLADVSRACEAALNAPNPAGGLDATRVQRLEHAAAVASALTERLATLAERSGALIASMEFAFLFDPVRKLLALGRRVSDGTLDPGRYDLLASEARLASFIAIARGDVPVSHWFHLSRPLTPVGRGSALVSWSGSMFEYLMPELMLREPPSSLLGQTCRLVVQRQISYAAERGIPWGISESTFNARNLEMTYQYSTFGVPGLGFRRLLGDDLVVAPYSTGLAAMIDPLAAVRNFERLAALGGRGAYGFYDALDFTPARLPAGSKCAIVRAYMAHHQGMLLVALANVLRGGVMRARFHADPTVQASELLLQERTPRDVPVARRRAEDARPAREEVEPTRPIARRYTSPHGSPPRTALLSNGRYTVMITAAGGGYSRWRDLAVTRWREDPTRDAWGTYVFLRDVASGDVWSAAYQPRCATPESYVASFQEDRVEISRRDGSITTRLEVIVSTEDDAEVRRVTIVNRSGREREIDVTSYAEVVLAAQAADAQHPAFSNLFVETEAIPARSALLAFRRPRQADEAPPWLAHVMAVEGDTVGDLQWECDRARFIGRGREIGEAVAIQGGDPLSNSAGAVLDPVVSLRRRIRIPAGQQARVTLTTLIAPSRDGALELAEKYGDHRTFERAAMLAWVQSQMQLHHLALTAEEAHLFQNLAAFVLYANRGLRPGRDVLTRWAGGQQSLWAHGVSGDVPIVLVQVEEPEEAGIVRQLLRAHEYWRLKGLAVDLVIINERATSYVQDLQQSLEMMVRMSSAAHNGTEPAGRVFVLRGDQISPAHHDVLNAAARAVLSSRGGTLAEQVRRAQRPDPPLGAPPRGPAAPLVPVPLPRPSTGPTDQLVSFNGYGGFTADGKEYVVSVADRAWTPAPWINIVANPEFGFHVSESGAGCTWCGSSYENRLTPWSNDPVSDPPGEVLYVRDAETGELWCPTALPLRDPNGRYTARHGQGYSRFAYEGARVALELLQFVPPDDAVKISRLRVTNRSGRARQLSVTAYVEWVLGTLRSSAAPFIVTEYDPDSGAILARNRWNTRFEERTAFATLGVSATPVAWTCDRTEFIGRNGSLAHPAALAAGTNDRTRLSGRTGPGLDPCAALQMPLTLEPGAHADIVFLLGQGATRDAARELASRHRTANVDAAFQTVTEQWDQKLGAVQVETPDPSLDPLVNRWLPYQTLACRVWARAAFYQSSGAYGFRDQLQDVMALMVLAPDLARAHLLRAAARQFVEGDVQHWWHPTTGRGVRTRISDDLLWLPYVVGHYLDVTGDRAVLDEPAPFLEGQLLAAEEVEAYFEPRISAQHGTLFEHCARALDRSLAVGIHGLPLIGTGDWNDGMNRVGARGKGESIWLGWFLCAILDPWADLARRRGEGEARVTAWRRHADALRAALERDGWDGEWYRRAFFDDGTPLGSSVDDACRIDSIAQSWSVISGAGDPEHRRQAMASLDHYLVRRAERLVLLLTPPFGATALEPGYIKGYVPGVRENGGQYTHAATWAALAFALEGDGDRAHELLDIINPASRTRTADAVRAYAVEPYVVAGDVYSEPPHVGRGGWTWYTGSSGWMYQVALERVLGFRVRGARLVIDPCMPRAWAGFAITYRRGATRYEIAVENPRHVTRGVSAVELDGTRIEAHGSADVALIDDGAAHRIRIILG